MAETILPELPQLNGNISEDGLLFLSTHLIIVAEKHLVSSVEKYFYGMIYSAGNLRVNKTRVNLTLIKKTFINDLKTY
jgi:hypothetical protein